MEAELSTNLSCCRGVVLFYTVIPFHTFTLTHGIVGRITVTYSQKCYRKAFVNAVKKKPQAAQYVIR